MVGLKWTSIDPVRFAKVGEEPGPLFLWVGVLPGTLSPDNAKDAAVRCKEILSEYEIVDVEIAFRESTYPRSVGPRLLNHVPSDDSAANIRIPFTPALGLRIAPKTFPYFEGTGCLYLCEGGGSDRVFLLTAATLSSHQASILTYSTTARTTTHLIVGSFTSAVRPSRALLGPSQTGLRTRITQSTTVKKISRASGPSRARMPRQLSADRHLKSSW